MSRFMILPNDLYIGQDLPRGDGPYPTRSLIGIDRVVFHHTAANPKMSAKEIASYHVNTRGWPGIGYHIGIMPDGQVQLFWPLYVVSYHVGYGSSYQGVSLVNWRSIGVALWGYFEGETYPTNQQLSVVPQLMYELNLLCSFFRGEPANLKMLGHREIDPGTKCPGSNYQDWWFQLRDETRLFLIGGA